MLAAGMRELRSFFWRMVKGHMGLCFKNWRDAKEASTKNNEVSRLMITLDEV